MNNSFTCTKFKPRKWTINTLINFTFVFSQILPQTKSNNFLSGQSLYKEYCAGCHGLDGSGKGDLSYLLYPKPRDFISGQFKIRSTHPGKPPTNQDLIKTIRNGMPGTAMPSFSFLNDSEINSLVDIVKEFSRMDNQNINPISIPGELLPSEELIALGKSIYAEVGCNMCHGDRGKGDGPSAQKLKDTQGYPIIPKDFTSGVYLGGGTNQDLYLRFVGGMDGTPMPSFGNLAEVLGKPKSEENKLAWALVHYVKSLEKPKFEQKYKLPEKGIIHARKTRRSVKPDEFLDGHSHLWEKAPTFSIPLSRLWQSDNMNFQMLEVQALYNNRYLAIKLKWADPSRDQGTYRFQDFQDGAAVQFSLDGTKGFHGMGSKEHPTDIWYWKADWQKRSYEKNGSDISLAYANRVSDSGVETFPTTINDVAYLAGRDAGNINSAPTPKTAVENVKAIGPQTVTPLIEQTIMGKGLWDGEKWQVVFVRKLKPDSDQQVDLTRGNRIPIGFAIWNGSEHDRNGQKMVTTWYDLELKD